MAEKIIENCTDIILPGTVLNDSSCKHVDTNKEKEDPNIFVISNLNADLDLKNVSSERESQNNSSLEVEESGQRRGNSDKEKNSNLGICAIDKYMIPAKVAYFFNNARYAINEYVILYYVSSGFDSANAGWINGIRVLGGIMAAPGWSFIADKMGIHRILACILCIMAIATTCTQPFLSENLGNQYKTVCPYKPNVTANFTDKDAFTNHSKNRLLFYFVITATIASSFDDTIVSFVDSGVIQRIHTSPQYCEYSHQRIFGSFGYAFGSIIYSVAIDYFPMGSISCYVGIFVVYSVLATLLTLSCCWLFNGIQVSNMVERRQKVRPTLLTTLRQIDILLFFISVLFTGILQGLWYGFIFLFMKDLDAPTLLLGFSVPVTCSSAILVYILSRKIIDVLGGCTQAMMFSCFAWALRFTCLAFIRSPYLVLAIDIMHGLTFSLFRIASLEYIKVKSDPVIVTSMCGINNTLNTCGLIAANMIGGYIYKTFGGRKLFIGASILSAFWGVVMIVMIIARRKK